VVQASRLLFNGVQARVPHLTPRRAEVTSWEEIVGDYQVGGGWRGFLIDWNGNKTA
jgi:hypothetical protein